MNPEADSEKFLPPPPAAYRLGDPAPQYAKNYNAAALAQAHEEAEQAKDCQHFETERATIENSCPVHGREE